MKSVPVMETLMETLMKAMQACLTRQLFEPSPEEPLLARKLFLVHRILPFAFLQVFDITFSLGQETQRCVPRSFRTQRYQHLQLFETISEVGSPIFLQLVMSGSTALGFFRFWPFCDRPHIIGYRHRRCIAMFSFSFPSFNILSGL